MGEQELRIETLAIGDEILTGRISDTNSTFVANEIYALGMRLQRQVAVADDFEAMRLAIEEGAARAQAVICFGGLGPTSDDKTAECAARLLGGKLVEHGPSKENLLRYYGERKREVTPQALKQVLYPDKATALPNNKGMAPGFSFEWRGCRFYFLPGVPLEMKAMFLESVLPALQQRGKHSVYHRTWRCIGIWESELQRVMVPVEAELPPNAWLGYQTRPPENFLTLYWKMTGAKQPAPYESRIREILLPFTYSEEEKDLEQLVCESLARKKWRIALAESCTGGLTVQRLTRITGASEQVWGGYVAYDTQAKEKMLDVRVPEERAVAAETSRTLAEQAREKSGCEVGAAVTGFVGPGGGTEQDPVGTIYLAAVSPLGLKQMRLSIPVRARDDAQWNASSHLLNCIRQVL